MDGKHDPEDHLKRHLHTLTRGIPAIAISLMRATLTHMSKFDKGQKLVKINLEHLPKYLIVNLDKYKNWIV